MGRWYSLCCGMLSGQTDLSCWAEVPGFVCLKSTDRLVFDCPCDDVADLFFLFMWIGIYICRYNLQHTTFLCMKRHKWQYTTGQATNQTRIMSLCRFNKRYQWRLELSEDTQTPTQRLSSPSPSLSLSLRSLLGLTWQQISYKRRNHTPSHMLWNGLPQKHSTPQVRSIEAGVNLACAPAHSNQYASHNVTFWAVKR